MGFPKAQWLTSSSLPAYCTAGHVTPQIFMLSFKSARHAQRFLSAHDQINNLFLLPRHRMTATRAERTRAFETWHDVCGIKQAA
jgi:hypothetical protein